MEFFRTGAVPVLVATDVAARGLDVDGMTCVINYDLPQCPEDYIHRIGRTGRAGSVGTALSFILEEDDSKWKDIVRTCHLGKIAELTKSNRPLPKPKFVPDKGSSKSKKVSIKKENPLPVASPSKPRLTEKKAVSAQPIKKKKPVQPTVQAPDNSFGFAVVRVGRKKKQENVSGQQEIVAKYRRPFSFHFKKRHKK